MALVDDRLFPLIFSASINQHCHSQQLLDPGRYALDISKRIYTVLSIVRCGDARRGASSVFLCPASNIYMTCGLFQVGARALKGELEAKTKLFDAVEYPRTIREQIWAHQHTGSGKMRMISARRMSQVGTKFASLPAQSGSSRYKLEFLDRFVPLSSMLFLYKIRPFVGMI